MTLQGTHFFRAIVSKVRTIRLGGLYWICLFSKLSGHFVSQLSGVSPLSSYPRWGKLFFPFPFTDSFPHFKRSAWRPTILAGELLSPSMTLHGLFSYYPCRQTKQTVRRCYCCKSDRYSDYNDLYLTNYQRATVRNELRYVSRMHVCISHNFGGKSCEYPAACAWFTQLHPQY